MKFEKILEHAFVASIAVASVWLDEWIVDHQSLNQFVLLKWVVLFLGAFVAIYLLTEVLQLLLVHFRTLEGVGRIDGKWKEGFANSNNDAPLGSFVAVKNTKEGFEVHGFPYTPQGDANHFIGMGIPWKKNRIMYFFEGLFRNEPRNGVGYLEFVKGEGGKPDHFDGMFFEDSTKTVRAVAGERFTEDELKEAKGGQGKIKDVVVRWAKAQPLRPQELYGVGGVDGCWVDRIKDAAGNLVGGSALMIERAATGFEIRGWSFRPDGTELGDFTATGLASPKASEVVYRFDGKSDVFRRGIGFYRFRTDAGAKEATTLDGYFVEEADKGHKLSLVKGRRVERIFDRTNVKSVVMDYLRELH